MKAHRVGGRLSGAGTVSSVEVLYAAFVTIVIAALASDLTIFLLGYENLDKTTRDCARAAGGQSNLTNATNAATSQLAAHKTDGYFCQQPQIVGTITYQDWSGSPYNGTGPAISGSSTTQCAYVSVKCSEGLRLPMPISFFGTSLSSFIPGSVLTLYRQYTFPIVKTKYSGS
jgi:hypothetical protein